MHNKSSALKAQRKGIIPWQTAGVLFIIGFGSVMHFFYEWTGYSPIAGLFAPVNESVWEHLKLGYWSLLVFSIIDYKYIKKKVNNYFIAKFCGILALELVILGIFYTYTSLIGRSILFIDIGSYALGALVCQAISYFIFIYKKQNTILNYGSLSGFIIIGVLFMVFTFFTPRLAIFRDHNTEQYGIEWIK